MKTANPLSPSSTPSHRFTPSSFPWASWEESSVTRGEEIRGGKSLPSIEFGLPFDYRMTDVFIHPKRAISFGVSTSLPPSGQDGTHSGAIHACHLPTVSGRKSGAAFVSYDPIYYDLDVGIFSCVHLMDDEEGRIKIAVGCSDASIRIYSLDVHDLSSGLGGTLDSTEVTSFQLKRKMNAKSTLPGEPLSNAEVSFLQFLPTRNRLLSKTSQVVQIWDLSANSFADPRSQKSSIATLDISQGVLSAKGSVLDPSLIAISKMNGNLCLYDIRSRSASSGAFANFSEFREKECFSFKRASGRKMYEYGFGVEGYVDIDWSPCVHHWIAAAGTNGNVDLFDIRKIQEPVLSISCHSSLSENVQFFPTQSDLLVSCGVDGSVSLCSLCLEPHHVVKRISEHGSFKAAFQRSQSSSLYVATESGTLLPWHIPSKDVRDVFEQSFSENAATFPVEGYSVCENIYLGRFSNAFRDMESISSSLQRDRKITKSQSVLQLGIPIDPSSVETIEDVLNEFNLDVMDADIHVGSTRGDISFASLRELRSHFAKVEGSSSNRLQFGSRRFRIESRLFCTRLLTTLSELGEYTMQMQNVQDTIENTHLIADIARRAHTNAIPLDRKYRDLVSRNPQFYAHDVVQNSIHTIMELDFSQGINALIDWMYLVSSVSGLSVPLSDFVENIVRRLVGPFTFDHLGQSYGFSATKVVSPSERKLKDDSHKHDHIRSSSGIGDNDDEIDLDSFDANSSINSDDESDPLDENAPPTRSSAFPSPSAKPQGSQTITSSSRFRRSIHLTPGLFSASQDSYLPSGIDEESRLFILSLRERIEMDEDFLKEQLEFLRDFSGECFAHSDPAQVAACFPRMLRERGFSDMECIFVSPWKMYTNALLLTRMFDDYFMVAVRHASIFKGLVSGDLYGEEMERRGFQKMREIVDDCFRVSSLGTIQRALRLLSIIYKKFHFPLNGSPIDSSGVMSNPSLPNFLRRYFDKSLQDIIRSLERLLGESASSLDASRSARTLFRDLKSIIDDEDDVLFHPIFETIKNYDQR